MEKTLHVQERTEKLKFLGMGEVNGQPVRIQIDSGASWTIVNRRLMLLDVLLGRDVPLQKLRDCQLIELLRQLAKAHRVERKRKRQH